MKNSAKKKETFKINFTISLYSRSEISDFEFYNRGIKITGKHEGGLFKFSFDQNIPNHLIKHIKHGKGRSTYYVMGYIFEPLQKVNQEIRKQKYETGNFMLNTFTVFDIQNIILFNEYNNDEIHIPWPPIFPPPPHNFFVKENDNKKYSLETFMKDYVDACTDFFNHNYDDCVKKMITSVENAFEFYNIGYSKKNYILKLIYKYLNKLSFSHKVTELFSGIKRAGVGTVEENLLFLYKIRNKITHGKLRLSSENGWWFCLKGLGTIQYLYQFLDGVEEESRGAYIFRTYGFLDLIFVTTRGGSFIDHDDNKPIDPKLVIDNQKDFEDWKFGCLLINKHEKVCILKNKNRE